MLAGDFELAALVLDLPEQPRVLDGQGRLGGEGPEEIDDLRRKLPGGLPDHDEAAEQAILADQRNREQGAVSGAARAHSRTRLSAARCQDVRHLDRLLRVREPSGRAFPFPDRRGEHRLDDLGLKLLGRARGTNTSRCSSYSKMTPPSVPESCTARATIVVSTVSRSSEELIARPTSPRAVSCSTERVSSCVRACSSLNRRTFSIAITA